MLAFFDGTPAYNVVNLGVGVIGLVLTIGSVVAARRAARAAIGARTEAEEAKRLIRGVTAGVELSGLRGYVREGVARLESGRPELALQSLVFVREQLSRYSRLAGGPRLVPPHRWLEIDRELADVADAIRESYAVDPPPGRLERADLVRRLLEIGAALAMIQAAAESETVGG